MTAKVKIRIRPKAKPNPSRRNTYIIVGVGLAAAAGLVALYYFSRQRAASSALNTSAGTSPPNLTVNGDTGLTTVMPGLPVPMAVTNGRPGGAVLLNMESPPGSGNISTLSAGTFDKNGTYNYGGVFGLNPNGPVTPNSMPFLTRSIPSAPNTTYNIWAQEPNSQARSNVVQVTVSLTSRNRPPNTY
jgi:hypothetical protein